MRFLAFAFALLTTFVTGLPALAENRVALLIGNSAYDNPALSLKNPVNDVADMATALGQLGFTVITAQDANKRDMERALSAFEAQVTGADIGLFFYAGHGSQAGGENFMLAADFKGNDRAAMDRGALTMGAVRDVFARAKPRAGIVILRLAG